MKQTAVEWLVDEIEKHYIINNGSLNPTVIMELKRQAKQMEKEQIINSFTKGFGEGVVVGTVTIYKHQTSEQYYNETYGK